MKSLRWKVVMLAVIILAVGVWIYFGEIGPAPPAAYPSNLARENGDVVHGENIDKLDRFVENLKAKGSDTVRIVTYTIEGDGILYDLFREDGKFTLHIDSTRDKYSTNRGIEVLKLRDIVKRTEEGTTEYLVILDTGEELPLLTVDNR